MITQEDEQRIREIVVEEMRRVFFKANNTTTLVIPGLGDTAQQVAFFLLATANGREKQLTGREPSPIETD
jgi:hypothetical protein